MKILIAGGSGFLGRALIDHFSNRGFEIVALTRGKQRHEKGVSWINWDSANLGGWISELRGIDVIINLTGKNVNCRYHEKNRLEILRSRTDSVKTISRGLAQAGVTVPLWLQASSATIYRHAEDRPMTEHNGEEGTGFSVEVCRAWESAFDKVQNAGRKILMRTGIVLGRDGGAWPVLRRLASLGLGGPMGKGSQYVSWLHVTDFVRMIEWFINNQSARGVYNCTSPGPLPNRDLMQHISERCGRLLRLRSPEWLLQAGARVIGTETELILKSRWVVPARLVDEGFQFSYTSIDKALIDLS